MSVSQLSKLQAMLCVLLIDRFGVPEECRGCGVPVVQ